MVHACRVVYLQLDEPAGPNTTTTAPTRVSTPTRIVQLEPAVVMMMKYPFRLYR